MPPQSTRLPVGFEIDRAARILRFTRQFSATPQAVFEAWTQPDQIASWWDAGGEQLSTCEIDLRVGGAFLFVSPSHPHMPFSGTYRTIEPPHLLMFDAIGSTGKVRIDDDGAGTRMIVEIVSPTAEHFEHFIEAGVHRGTAQTLDNLVAYLRP